MNHPLKPSFNGWFCIAVGAAGGIVFRRIASAPITRMAKAANRIGKGRLVVHGSQKIRELAETFNKMANDLQRSETMCTNLVADVSHELRTPLPEVTMLPGRIRYVLFNLISNGLRHTPLGGKIT